MAHARIQRPELSRFHRPPAWVEEYIVVPWKPYGRERDGCDCWGMLRLVSRERFDNDLPAYGHWTWNDGAGGDERIAARRQLDELISGERTKKDWRTIWEARSAPAAEPLGGGLVAPGDAILIQMMGHPIHVGIVVAPGWMLHIEEPPHESGHESYGKCVEYDGLRWARQVFGFYRWSGARC